MTYGGQQRWLLEVTRLLNDRGHPVVVHQRATTQFTHRLNAGVVVRGHRCSTRAAGSPWFNLVAHRAIPKRAAVIYMVEDLAFPRCRPRSMVVQHGIWWDGEYGWAKVRFAERIARHAVRRAGAVLCVDTNFINWYRARWPESGDDAKLHYAANFIDPEQWGPQPLEPAARIRAGEPIQVCFPRRSEPRRGIWLMTEAAPRLAARHPDVRFRFVVGSGFATERLRERLIASGMPGHQWRLESLPFERMREAYERSPIAVIPTVCGEGTSLSAIEAMYFGCGVVSSWVGGLPNLIQHGHNGLLVTPSPGEVESGIERLITDTDLRVRLGRAAMAAAPALYGLPRWRAQVGPVLERALGVAAG